MRHSLKLCMILLVLCIKTGWSESWEWNTFMGDLYGTEGRSIAVDGNGNVYVAGRSYATWGSPVNAHEGGGLDAFAAKLNSSGVLQWNTFMGGSSLDAGYSIAVDGSANVYVAGNSKKTWGSPVNAHAGGDDAFVAKLNSSGVLQWNTFMGSSGNDFGESIAVDGSGNVYVAGHSEATWGSPVNDYAGGLNDAFAAKLNSSGVLQWNTFMGGSSWDEGNSIAVDGSGNVFIAGESKTTWGSPVNAYAGGDDAFAAKLNSNGVLQWNTFMGGSSWDDDYGYSITVDGGGNVYVAGRSEATWGSPVNAHAGGWNDAFAAKLNSSGVLQWNTFMGGSDRDYGNGIAVDGSGNVYVAGRSEATWGSPANAFAGASDAFAAKLNSSGVRQGNTFMGSSDNDRGYGISVDGSANVYVAGYGNATWGSPVNAHAGGSDAFAVKFDYSNIVKVETDLGLPTEFKLAQNYPNPFNPTTTIEFAIPKPSEVSLKIYDILGRELVALVDEEKQPGEYKIVFDASGWTSGVYLYSLKTEGFSQLKKLLLLK